MTFPSNSGKINDCNSLEESEHKPFIYVHTSRNTLIASYISLYAFFHQSTICNYIHILLSILVRGTKS